MKNNVLLLVSNTLIQYLPNFKFGNEYWADIWENMGEKFTQAGLHAA